MACGRARLRVSDPRSSIGRSISWHDLLTPISRFIKTLSYSASSVPPPVGTRSDLAAAAGWGSRALLLVLSAIAFWGRGRRQFVIVDEPIPEPVSVG